MLENNQIYNSYYSWWKNIDKFILFLILCLFFLGLFFSLVSTSLIASDKLDTNSYYFFFKHLFFILLAISTLIIFSFFDKNKLLNISLFLFIIFFICLVLVPFIGIEVKGSKRWMDFGWPFPTFQPIELLKPFFIVLIASILSMNSNKKIYFNYFLSFLVVIPIILLLISQPDIGQTLLIVMTWLSLIFISGVNLIIFFSFFILISSVLSYLIFFIPKFEYIKIRLLSFLDPSSGNNYQSEKASEAIINGGFFGQGIGEGTLNSKIPEAHTDYIVSVISEEFGVIIVIVIMLIYLILAYKVIQKIGEEKDNKVKLILLGSISLILLQTFIHIGVNIRILPTTGMTLPFLSYGGSSIISIAILSGIILNFTKRRINLL
tara:strand:+ start:3887 stop:5017 length:1131 start_codon:yes stop_codon:yes gene_type:complete